MNDDNSDRDPLEELAAEFTERCRRGEEPSVEEYATRHPAMAGDIRELFGMILQVERAKTGGMGSSASRPAAVATMAARLGDFRIIREIGHGGMGVVYEAEQESLGRRVAIKVLPAQYLASRVRRERFEREARTAAKLHHTNIVQIFGVGEQDGHPYFVMQYINGVGLDGVFRSLVSRRMNTAPRRDREPRPEVASSDLVQVARELLNAQILEHPATGSGPVLPTSLPSSWITGSVSTPASGPDLPEPMSEPQQGLAVDRAPVGEGVNDLTYWRSLAKLLAQPADALSFAHRQGVLHRDVKPANLLLDTEGMLWVADFGLAKAGEFQELTQAGDAVGTLRYMAPEQHASQADERSDVYGLGITLYELATLSMAFVGSHGGSDLRAIMEAPLLPPRRLCPSMPQDLETIILKAAAREPGHRYVSAAALRDDLLRFAEDRPIQARRISSAERLWRWARRNPALATTTALALALLIATAAVASVAYFKVRGANSAAQRALVAQTHQRERAEATADLAVAALDAIFDEFAPASPVASREVSLGGSDSDSLVVTVPSVLSPETATFLKGMLRFYRELAQQGGNSPSLLLKMAAACRRVGEICELLGQDEDAKAAFVDSIQQYERLRKDLPDNVHLEVALARAEIQLGLVFTAEDEAPQASRHYHAARRILQARLEGGVASEEETFELARAYYLLSRPPSAGTPMNGVEPPERRGAGALPGGVGGPMPPPGEPGGPAPPPGPPPRPRQDFLPPGPPGPGRPEPGRPEPGEGDRPDPEQGHLDLRQAIDLLARLSQEAPKAPAYRLLLAQCLREPQGFPPPASQPGGAGPVDQAVSILESLVAEFPHAPQYQFELSKTYTMSAPRSHSTEPLEKARLIVEDLVSRWPNVPSYRFELGQINLRLAQECRREGQAEPGLASLKRATEIQTALVQQYPSVPTYVMTLASYEAATAQWYEDQAQYDQARKLLESAVSRMDAVVATEGHKPHVRGFASFCGEQLADVYQRLGDSERARKTREKWGPFGQGPGPAPGARAKP